MQKDYFYAGLVNNLIQSPLNYTGGKFKLLPQILPYFPRKINTFVDLFCGGCNVGININAEQIIYNDSNQHLLYLYNTFKNLDKDTIFDWIYQIIAKYGLSMVSKNGYDYYNCDSSKGLGAYNKERFLKLRHDFNEADVVDYYYYIMLYVLIVFSFNNQIRFNSKGEFNLPVGKRDFNCNMANKLSAFIDRIKEQNSIFTAKDFRKLDVAALNSNDFVYVDPPYLITCATYNEKGGWTDDDELALLSLLDDLNAQKIPFALSNVTKSKGRENEILLDWILKNSNRYKVIHLNYSYANANYQTSQNGVTDEVLIINY